MAAPLGTVLWPASVGIGLQSRGELTWRDQRVDVADTVDNVDTHYSGTEMQWSDELGRYPWR